MRILFIIIIFMFSCDSLMAQLALNMTMIDLGALATKTTKPASQWDNLSRNPGIEGSQYLDKLWYKGSLILKSDTLIEGLEFRYDIYAHEMQLRINKDTMAFTHPDLIRTMEFNNRTFIYGSFENNNISNKDYLELLVEGKCRLLLRREVTFVPKNANAAPINAGYLYDRFILSENFYLQIKGASVVFVKCTKKSILSHLGDHQNELKQYIQTEKIRFNKKNEIIKLIIYYNSLS